VKQVTSRPAAPAATVAAPTIHPTRFVGAPRSILEDIRIDFGPPEELGRLFLHADTSARVRGLRLSFGSLEELLDANRRNQASWQPLVPIFNPDIGGGTPDTAFCVLARNASGEVVGTSAVRLYTWLDTNLKIEGESLRLFYADPEASKMPGEECVISAPSAEKITGRAVFGGAVWYRPDFRNMGLHEILGRVAKAAAFTRWYTDVNFAFMAKHIVDKNFAQRSGYNNLEWDVLLKNSPWGTARVALLTNTTAEMLKSYYFEYSGALDPQVDTGIGDRARDEHRRA